MNVIHDNLMWVAYEELIEGKNISRNFHETIKSGTNIFH